MAALQLSRKQWPFAPQAVNNCLLWLDAADTSSYTSSSSISTWRNKGYAGGTATTTSGTIGSTTADINGLPAMSFGTNAYMTAPSMTFTQTTRTVFVIVNNGASGTVRRFMCSTGSNTIDSYILTTGTDLEFNYNGNYNYITAAPYPIFNTTSIMCGTTLSTNGGIFVNGLAQTPYSTNTPAAFGTGATTTQTIGYSTTGTFVLGEAMIFDGAITDIQRQQVEGYLAQKWGLQSLLPTTHPYFTLNNLITYAFKPTQIPTCALWLDASDATSITGTSVYQWKDKSGNGNNMSLTAGTVSYLSNLGQPCVNFTSGGILQTSTYTTITASQSIIFVICQATAMSGASFDYVFACSDINSGDSSIRFYPNTTTLNDGFAGTTFYVNGVSYTSGTNSLATGYNLIDAIPTGQSGSTRFSLSSSFNSRYFIGNICEVIVYSGPLTTNQRQAVESYLGTKWNIPVAGQGNVAPVVNPLAISGCQLWLDAADATTIVPVVSTWNDKSGEGNNLSLTAGSVTYVTQPGPPCVNFASGGILQTSNYISLTTTTAIFVVAQATSLSSGWGYVFAFSDILSGDYSIRYYTNTTSIYNGNNGDIGYLTGYYVNGVLSAYVSAGTTTVPTGYNLIDTVNTSQSGSTRISLSSSSNSRYFVGNIREVIVYTGPITTTQRQQVENYLMAKWGTGRNFWIDGSDATTVTKGTTMVQWNDKSGNGYNLIPGSGITTYVPYSTYPSVKLNTSYMYVNKPVNLTQYTMFIAVLSQTAVNNQTVFTGRPNTSTSYGSLDGFGFYVDSTAPDLRFYYANSQITNYTSSGSISQPPVIAAYTCTSTGVTYSWVNGASGTSYTAGGLTRSSTAQGFSIGGEWQGSSYGNLVSVSNVYEIIVYNTVLTNTQVQQIQTYLGNKWGVTVSNPTAGITNPTLIPSCVLWLDAADPTTIITAVTQMNDKSGNGYNITQSTASYQPVLTNNYLTLGTSLNSYMNMPQAAINNTSSWTLFLVFNPISSTNWIMVKQYDGNNTYNALSMTNYTSSGGGNTTGTTGVLYFHAYNAGTLFTGPSALTTSTNQLLTLICNGTNIYYYINGVLAAITNGTFTIQSQTGATNATLGAWISSGSLVNSGVTNFQLGELDFYNSALTTSQTQQIEASLMNKWSITNTVQTANGSLIDTPFLPTDITGCVVWYDGADTSNMVMTGTAMTTWKDKSGNGYNATGVNSPAYVISTGGVSFTAASVQYFTMSVPYSKTNTMFMVASPVPSSTSGMYYMNTSVGNAGSFFLGGYNSSYICAYLPEDTVPEPVFSAGLPTNPFVVCLTKTTGATYTGYYNGVQVFTGTESTTDTASTWAWLGGAGVISGTFYNALTATIYELVIYNSALSTAQIAKVNSYLQRKWNTALTVTTIPTPVYNRPFQPVDITGCLLWLDAYDLTTLFQNTAGTTAVTAAGQQVQYWADKSGNANNATSSETAMTYNTSGIGYPSIYFSGSQTNGLRTNVVVTDSTYFYVVYMTQTSGVYVFSGHQGPTHLKQNYTANNLLQMDYSGIGGIGGSVGMNTTTIVTRQDTSSSGLMAGWQNGASIGSKSMGVTGETFTQLSLGVDYPSGFTGILYMSEVIIYNSVLSTGQRQQVEAYLAWKYGLISSLASGHPGRTLPSFSTVFSPKTISGLQMWLDGTDPNATGVPPANGTTVSTWYDKSGNGYNATVASGKIAGTYSTANKAIYCTASNTGYVTSYTAAPSLETMFVVFNNPSPSGNNNMVIGGPQGARSLSGGYAGGGAGVGAVSYLNNEVTWTGMASMPASTYTSGTTVIITGQVNGLTTSISQNGGTIYSNTTASAFTAGTTTYLGTDYYSASYYYIGYEMEVIFYNSLLTLSQRQQVEGYLAWKWGLASSLPTTHPFKKFAP